MTYNESSDANTEDVGLFGKNFPAQPGLTSVKRKEDSNVAVGMYGIGNYNGDYERSAFQDTFSEIPLCSKMES